MPPAVIASTIPARPSDAAFLAASASPVAANVAFAISRTFLAAAVTEFKALSAVSVPEKSEPPESAPASATPLRASRNPVCAENKSSVGL